MASQDETQEPEGKMDTQQVIDYLGISRATLFRRIEQKAITPLPKPPYLKRRHKLVFRRSDVEALKYMEQGEVMQ